MERPDFYALSVYQRLKGKMTRLLEPVLQGEGLTLLQGYVLLLLDRSGVEFTRQYLLATLYNAPMTMNSSYAARVQYDFKTE